MFKKIQAERPVYIFLKQKRIKKNNSHDKVDFIFFLPSTIYLFISENMPHFFLNAMKIITYIIAGNTC